MCACAGVQAPHLTRSFVFNIICERVKRVGPSQGCTNGNNCDIYVVRMSFEAWA